MTATQIFCPDPEACSALTAHRTTTPLRLCMISDDFLPAATGVGIHVQCLARNLAARGHPTSVVTTRRPGEAAQENWHGVRVYRTFSLPMYGFWQALPSMRMLRRILSAEAPDIIHYHYIGYLMRRTQKIANNGNAKQVYTWHMTADHLTQPWPMRPFRRLIARSVVNFCNRCDYVIAPSMDLTRRIATEGVRAPRGYVSNPVMFEEETGPMPAERKSGAFQLLYVGRLNKEKNIVYLLRAFARLLARVPDAELSIVGLGDQKKALERLCVDLRVTGSVRFLGYLSRRLVAQQYEQADVFVLPSLVEAQPIVALEAMYFGKPLIVTDRIVSARELVEPGVNGFIVDPDSDEDLAEKLVRLHDDPALRLRMGQAGGARAEAFNPKTFADRTESIYRAVRAGSAFPR